MLCRPGGRTIMIHDSIIKYTRIAHTREESPGHPGNEMAKTRGRNRKSGELGSNSTDV